MDERSSPKKLYYGNHETQFSEGGEADLFVYKSSCIKNPGHNDLIPITDFSLDHLPDGFQSEKLYQLTRSLADLTVRVDIRLVSDLRPSFWPESEVSYPFSDKKGSSSLRTGSGRIRFVYKYSDKQNKPCPCLKCSLSGEASMTWWKVDVLTATHVVFDQSEVQSTTCKLFYNSDDSSVITLAGLQMVRAEVERDWCEFTCATCDAELIGRLEKMTKSFYGLIKEVHDEFENEEIDTKKNLAIIVSHPHGCPKCVAIGRWSCQDVADGGNSRYIYTTCTCPGSSGAWVYMLRSNWWYNFTHVHSGVSSDGNFSGTAMDFL